MKRTLSAILVLALCLALCACGASAPAPTPEPTPNPSELLYNKYADIIDALEAEDYDGAVEAVNAMRPAPEITEVEITMDNLWDYFEIVEDKIDKTDAHGELSSRQINRKLALKDDFILAELAEYPTDVAVGFEYDYIQSQYLKPCTIDFDTFTCDSSVTWRDVTHESEMAHFPKQPQMDWAIADRVSGDMNSIILSTENFEILNASGTLYLVNK